jgi:hypothetical protein
MEWGNLLGKIRFTLKSHRELERRPPLLNQRKSVGPEKLWARVLEVWLSTLEPSAVVEEDGHS